MTCPLSLHYAFLLKIHSLSVPCTGCTSIWQVLPWITKEGHLLELGGLGAATTFPLNTARQNSWDTAAAQLSALISYGCTKNNHPSLISPQLDHMIIKSELLRLRLTMLNI